MTWQYANGRYSLPQDEYLLRVWLDPAMPHLIEPGDLGTEEHPFAWLFEVEHCEDGLEFRGQRETLLEAQQAALRKVREVLPDAPAWAVGY